MRLRVLRPVGERITLGRPSGSAHTLPGSADRVVYTDSGTSALALILESIASRARQVGRAASQVLIPAYACPDVVSAVVHAGLDPELVDLAQDSPFPSANDWAEAIDEKTLALVTVGVLGLSDPFTPAQAIAAGLQSGTFIEDCCQIHPMAITASPDRNIALSFGRGKPVSLLHGGAALLLPENLRSCPVLEATHAGMRAYVGTAVAARLYNVLCSPWLYGWVTRVPGFGVGMTGYSQLRSIGAMNEQVRDHLDPGAGWNDPRRRNLQATIRELLRSIGPSSVAVDLWQRFGGAESWLLRYPLLLKNQHMRDDALARLNRQGLGASGMYMHPLPEIPGMEAVVPDRRMENARSFASRLLTLPLHGDVREADAREMCRILGEVGAQ